MQWFLGCSPILLKSTTVPFKTTLLFLDDYITVNVEYISNALNERVGLLGQIISFETNVIVMQAINYVLAAC